MQERFAFWIAGEILKDAIQANNKISCELNLHMRDIQIHEVMFTCCRSWPTWLICHMFCEVHRAVPLPHMEHNCRASETWQSTGKPAEFWRIIDELTLMRNLLKCSKILEIEETPEANRLTSEVSSISRILEHFRRFLIRAKTAGSKAFNSRVALLWNHQCDCRVKLTILYSRILVLPLSRPQRQHHGTSIGQGVQNLVFAKAMRMLGPLGSLWCVRHTQPNGMPWPQ